MLIDKIIESINNRRMEWAESRRDSDDDEFRKKAGMMIDILDEISDIIQDALKK